MNLIIEHEPWREAVPSVETLTETALAFISQELSILLADDATITQMNQQYRGKDRPTNVLSFPSDQPDYLGDIIIALETLQREAAQQGKTLQDHYTHMLIHGALHLQGYDHETDEEAEMMEAREIALLAKLKIANPYETE